jgi:DNA-binding CsgD family transcriptional regulator
MSATLTKPELAATPPANTSAIRPYRITVAAAVAALRDALSLPHGVEDPLVISIVPGLALVLVADRLITEPLAHLTGAMAVLEGAERALAPVLGPGQTRPPDSRISPREREVLALVVAGHSNKGIAEALFVSLPTVKSHVASLLAKLDADNRAHLAVIAMQRGLLAE